MLLAAAVLDRLLENAHIIEMTGDSYQTSPRAKKNGTRGNAAPPPA